MKPQMLRATLFLVLASLTAGAQTTAAPSAPLPTFDVATVKPSPPQTTGSVVNWNKDTFITKNIPVAFLLKFAYSLNTGSNDQLINAPEWIQSEHFDINAKEDDELVAKLSKMSPEEHMTEMRLLMQSLLADRFQLHAHFETRQMPVLALVIVKSGLKITPSTPDAPKPTTPADPDAPRPKSPTESWEGFRVNIGHAEARHFDIGSFTNWLSNMPEVGHKMTVNQTGLNGVYNFTLDWVPDSQATTTPGPGLFTAIQEQLGLKLEATRASVQVLVIDSISQPSDN